MIRCSGGSKGLLVNSVDLCGKRRFAAAEFAAQNGKLGDQRPLLRSGCGKR